MEQTPATSFNDVASFIASAGQFDLGAIDKLLRKRRTALGRQRTAQTLGALAVGTPVQLADISPRELAGLTGTIAFVSGFRASVALDTRSTALLINGRSQFANLARQAWARGERTVELPRIPVASLVLL